MAMGAVRNYQTKFGFDGLLNPENTAISRLMSPAIDNKVFVNYPCTYVANDFVSIKVI